MLKVFLHINPERDPGFLITRRVCALLKEAGIEAAADRGLSGLPDGLVAADGYRGCRMIICLGGDGTILHIASSAARAGLPILGVNLGNKGFMAALERDEINKIPAMALGDHVVEARMMLDICVTANGRKVYSALALNDLAITNGMSARVLDLTVRADRSTVSSFRGDGVVLATPTGSTAYSLSAGGPIVEPTAENILVTPVCAHLLYARALVLSADRTITVSLGPGSDRGAYLSVDGARARRILPEYTLSVQKSSYKTRLIHSKDTGFYDIIYKKMISERGT